MLLHIEISLTISNVSSVSCSESASKGAWKVRLSMHGDTASEFYKCESRERILSIVIGDVDKLALRYDE